MWTSKLYVTYWCGQVSMSFTNYRTRTLKIDCWVRRRHNLVKYLAMAFVCGPGEVAFTGDPTSLACNNMFLSLSFLDLGQCSVYAADLLEIDILVLCWLCHHMTIRDRAASRIEQFVAYPDLHWVPDYIIAWDQYTVSVRKQTTRQLCKLLWQIMYRKCSSISWGGSYP